jgi:hypothetical protein
LFPVAILAQAKLLRKLVSRSHFGSSMSGKVIPTITLLDDEDVIPNLIILDAKFEHKITIEKFNRFDKLARKCHRLAMEKLPTDRFSVGEYPKIWVFNVTFPRRISSQCPLFDGASVSFYSISGEFAHIKLMKNNELIHVCDNMRYLVVCKSGSFDEVFEELIRLEALIV